MGKLPPDLYKYTRIQLGNYIIANSRNYTSSGCYQTAYRSSKTGAHKNTKRFGKSVHCLSYITNRFCNLFDPFSDPFRGQVYFQVILLRFVNDPADRSEIHTKMIGDFTLTIAVFLNCIIDCLVTFCHVCQYFFGE